MFFVIHFHCHPYHEDYQCDIWDDGDSFTVHCLPVGQVNIDIGKLEDCADDTHQSTAGDESGGDERAFFLSLGIDLGVLAAGADEPGDSAADEQRQVQVDRDEHSERERKSRYLAHCQDDSDEGADAVEDPWSAAAVHKRLDHSCHGIGLRRDESIVPGETEGLVQHEHHAADGCSSDGDTRELPDFLLLRRRADPISDFQVGHERACDGQRGADDSADDQRRRHTGIALQADGHEYQ